MRRPHQAVSVAEACVPNIGTRGQRRRLLGGLTWLTAALAASALLMLRAAAPLWQLAVLPAWGLAMIGFLQAREKT